MRLFLPALLLACPLILAACGAAGPGDEPVVRDSAGVRIVENTPPGERTAFVLDAEPALSIGLVEGPEAYTFRGIRGAARLEDGGIVVADGAELKFYDAAGRHRITAGGEGEGPGEFTFLNAVFRCGDEVVAGDMRQQHLTVYDGDGRFLRTLSLPRSGHQFFALYLLGCDVVTGHAVLRPPAALTRAEPGAAGPSTVPILRLTAEAGRADTVAEVPIREQARAGGGPFAAAMRYAWDGRRVHVVDTEFLAVRTYGPDALRQIARIPHDPRPVTDEDHRRAIDTMVARVAPAFAERGRARLEQTTPPPHMPAINIMMADAAGRVWIRPFAPIFEPPATRWLVLDDDGTLLGGVQLPDGFRPLDIGEEWVLGVWEDELNVGYVRLYRFGPGAS